MLTKVVLISLGITFGPALLILVLNYINAPKGATIETLVNGSCYPLICWDIAIVPGINVIIVVIVLVDMLLTFITNLKPIKWISKSVTHITIKFYNNIKDKRIK